MTLTEFVTARLDEAEVSWKMVAARDVVETLRGEPIAPRMLAQVAAMRAIVDAYEEAERLHSSNLEKFSALASAPAHSYDAAELTRIKTHGWELSGRRLALRHSVRHLAAIWRDHDQYDPAWAPEGEQAV